MSFLDIFVPVKKVNYQTALSPQKVAQRLESKISPEPIKKSFFDRIPLTYRGEITEKAFEIGRRSRGNKDHPPTAYGIIKEENKGSSIELNIVPNELFKTGLMSLSMFAGGLFILVIILFLIGNTETALGFLFFGVFFSLGFLANSLIFRYYNTKFSKDIEQLIDGKIIK